VTNHDAGMPTPVKSRTISDRTYELYTRRCPDCDREHLEVWRWSGLSFSRYHFPADFEPNDFEYFVESIDEALLMSASEMFADFHRELEAVNSPRGIEANHSFEFRLLEYGRDRCCKLRELGALDAIVGNSDTQGNAGTALRAAFELGMATAEHRLIAIYEEYIHSGMALKEWRESGLPKASAERRRLGNQTRNAITGAAKQLYASDRLLVRNDAETARRILALDLPALQKGRGVQLTTDAITKHLRAARRTGCL